MADATLPPPTIKLMQDEKAYAGLAHALMMGTWGIGPLAGVAITLTLGIMFCLKAMRGEWAGYPVIGRWAQKIVGF